MIASHAARLVRVVCTIAVAALVLAAADTDAEPLPLEQFSPSFIGMYRKVIEVEDQIRRHANAYGVDFDLARAVCLYESGGNPGLASHAGAQGYFQVMPATYRELGVSSNIEAGVKYLAQMIQQFGREDRAVAAYNAGPGRVGRTGSLPLETVQYVIGVGTYRSVLKQFDDSLRHHAARLRLTTVRDGEDWLTIAARVGIPAWQLRLHNPFLAGRRLRTGERLAYPPEPREDLLTPIDGGAAYRMRHGDHYIKLAITLGLDLEALRAENGLWQTQSVPAGVVLRIPLTIDRDQVIKTALMDPEARPVRQIQPAVSRVVVSSTPEAPLGAAALRAAPVRQPAKVTHHRVERGDTLSTLARRYRTTAAAIQRANRLQGTTIRVGQSLRIP